MPQLASNDCYYLCVIQSGRRIHRRMKDGGSQELTIRAGEQTRRRERTREISGDSETANKTTKTTTY